MTGNANSLRCGIVEGIAVLVLIWCIYTLVCLYVGQKENFE